MIIQSTLLNAAGELAAHGCSVIPVNLKTKHSLGGWKRYQSIILSDKEIEKIFSNLNDEETGVAIVCGKVSGGLEVLDFDNHDGLANQRFDAYINDPETMSYIAEYKIPYERTQSGGRHLFFRSEACQRNQTLAKVINREDDIKQPITIIETRGEGGYCLCSPSKNYEILHGSLDSIPVLPKNVRDDLISRARIFHDLSLVQTQELRMEHAGQRPGDVYNADSASGGEVMSLLKEAGWVECGRRETNIFLRRPGKTNGVSASFNGTTFYVFSSNASPFDVDKGYSLFSVFSILKHQGNFKEAAKELAQRSNGGSDRPISTEDLQEGFIRRIIDKKNGGYRFDIRYDRFIQVLNEAGFRSFVQGSVVRLLRVNNQIVEEVFIHDISRYAVSSISDPDKCDFLIKNEAKLFTIGKLALLKTHEDGFNSDTPNTGWLYFRNTAVCVTKGSTEFHCYDYKDLPKPVWRKKIMDRDFHPESIGRTGSEMEQFFRNVSGRDEDQFQEMRLAVGYLLHGEKQSSNAKAVIFIDSKIPENDDDANGGTGKSLAAKYLGRYRNMVSIPGRQPIFKSQFPFQKIDHDTDIMLFDDVGSKFDFQNLFETVTGDMTVEKKHQQAYTVPFEKVPKILITTNYTIEGTGNSFVRRKWEISFAPFYNESHIPHDDFQHNLITDWSSEQWELEDAFALNCLQYYLDHGVPAKMYHAITDIRQLISETRADFTDFLIEEYDAGNISNKGQIDRKACYERYTSANGDANDVKFQMFTRWLNKFGSILGVKMKCTRSHSKNYVRFEDGLDKAIELLRGHTRI